MYVCMYQVGVRRGYGTWCSVGKQASQKKERQGRAGQVGQVGQPRAIQFQKQKKKT